MRRPALTKMVSLSGMILLVNLGGWTVVEAIVDEPVDAEIEKALERGRELGKKHQPPIELYAHFGKQDGARTHGFLMTKLGGIAVMSGHYALRGETPTPKDIARALEEEALQVVVTIYGDSPIFAKGSYLTLQQEGHLISPTRIRMDGRASRSKFWPKSPAFRAKIVASFAYGTFNLEGPTWIAVFPGVGGEEKFQLDFSQIP